MSKFKKGNKVKTKNGYSFDPAEGIIIEIDGSFFHLKITKSFSRPKAKDHWGKDKKWSYNENQLEPITRNAIEKLKMKLGL